MNNLLNFFLLIWIIYKKISRLKNQIQEESASNNEKFIIKNNYNLISENYKKITLNVLHQWPNSI